MPSSVENDPSLNQEKKVSEAPTSDSTQVTKNLRRNRVGERLEDVYNWPQADFEALESPCSLQEYLQDLIRRVPHDVPLLLKIPEAQSPDIWLYEHLRQLCLELTYLVVRMQKDCTAENCPEMKASEWFYLCASHSTPQNCCAIDYIVHTLDGATSLLNSAKYFPSRISVPSGSIKHFLSISRRIYRIFAHAWYHHKSIFDDFENQTYLYSRFMGLSTQYELIPVSLINIPSDQTSNPASKDSTISKKASVDSDMSNNDSKS